MIYLKLSPQESIELLRILNESGDRRIADKLQKELIETLESLDNLERDNVKKHASAWIERQQQIIKTMEK